MTDQQSSNKIPDGAQPGSVKATSRAVEVLAKASISQLEVPIRVGSRSTEESF